jgi:uncharacterized membrane protein YdjX (TVP38/TMEM64 family)
MMIYVGFVVFLLPATIMTLAGAYTFAKFYGFIKGFLVAWLCSFTSALIGAIISFIIGRTFFRETIRKHLI